MLIKLRKNKNKDYINISSLFLISLLFLLGFIGPGFWKINSPNFKFVVFQRDANKVNTIVNQEEKFNFNNKYLTLDQKIGRAHVRTPVTSLSRMPSSA